MSVSLYRQSLKSWVVESVEAGFEAEVFTSIEDACELMLKLGVNDDDIDVALIELSAHGHTRARFGNGGKFIETDEARHHGAFGIA